MAIIGKHQINFRLPGDSGLNEIQFKSRIDFDEQDYSTKKSFGTDTWVLNVGKVFSEVLSNVIANQDSHQSIQISNLQVAEFKKGLMQWSTHKVVIEFEYELKENGQSIQKGEIEGVGTGSGTEFGLLTFIPVLGNINFDKGIEVALSRSVESGLERLKEVLKV